MAWLTKFKAKKILTDKEVRGKKLTKKQKGLFGLFGLIAWGDKPTRLKFTKATIKKKKWKKKK